MDRRNFLRSIVGGVALGAAQRAFPFRVFSFPSEVKAPTPKFIMICNPGRIDGLALTHWWIAESYDPTGPWKGIERIKPGFPESVHLDNIDKPAEF